MDPRSAAEAFDRCLSLILAGERRLTVCEAAPADVPAAPTHRPGRDLRTGRRCRTGRLGTVGGRRAGGAGTTGTPRTAAAPALLGPYVPPGTDLERLLTGLWAEALRIESVGVTDDFFDLGGDS
ncbi:phosphopantetheine-binding protein [Streptomyces sp. M19]